MKAQAKPKEAPIPERTNPPAAEDNEGVDEEEPDPPFPPPEWSKRRARKTVMKCFQSVAKGEEVSALLKKTVRARDHWWGKVKVADAAGFIQNRQFTHVPGNVPVRVHLRVRG